MKYFRFSKPIARHLYMRGCKVLLFPCKANLNSPWITPHIISRETSYYDMNQFNRSVQDFIIYNCCYCELGYYPHYYVSEEEIERTLSQYYLDHVKEEIYYGIESKES